MGSLTDTPTFTEELLHELGTSIRGKLYPKGDPNFTEYTIMFNGNVEASGQVVACPLDVEDVSKIVLFCNKYSFSPSVKAGGYGTAGWAVGGDIIIDMSRIVDIDIEPPSEDGTYTSIRDMAPSNSKGKNTVPRSDVQTGKRRREEDALLRTYNSASTAVAVFLGGSSRSDAPPPTTRRRLNDDLMESQSQDHSSSSETGTVSVTDSGPQDQSSSSEQTGQALATTLYVNNTSTGTDSNDRNSGSNSSSGSGSPSSTPGQEASNGTRTPFNADPFGYLNASGHQGHAGVRTNFHSTSRILYGSWGPGPSSSRPNVPMTAPTATPNIPSESQPIHPHAFVTFGAGMRQKEVDMYTASHPLKARSSAGGEDSIPYHVPFAAHPVGSSVMLLGGFGFLSRLHGLSIDNLVEVEMVLADGRIVIVNEKEHPDLWWAIRGAGPAFGIVTRYKAKAHPVPVVFAGNLIYRFHKATAASLIKHFRDCIKGAPRELYANVLLTAGPQGKDSLVVIQMCYVGSQEKGQEYLAAIAAWDGEKCLLNEVHEKSFLHQQDSVAQVLRGKAGRQWFIRSALITSLPDDVVHETVLNFSDTPVGCTWLFELAGGAITDYEDTCLPKSQRDTLFTIVALHQWEMGVNDVRCITTAQDWIFQTLKPIQTGGPFPSFLGRHEPSKRTIATYGSNWDRLKEIKKLYDPTNLLRNSMWPLSADGHPVEAYTHEPLTPPEAGTSMRPLLPPGFGDD